MKKNISLFLLATSLVAAIAIGCDGTGYVEDVVEEDTTSSCPSGLVLRVSDGQCVVPEEDVIDDSASDMTEEIEEDVAEDTAVTDPCEAWAWLEGTEWSCGGGDRTRITLWVTEDTNECALEATIIAYNEFFFAREMDDVFFSPPPPAIPSSFTITEPTFYGNCTLITDE